MDHQHLPPATPVRGLRGRRFRLLTLLLAVMVSASLGYRGRAAAQPKPGLLTAPPTAAAALGLAIRSGTNHNCVLIAGGTVQCWGDNSRGQLGDGTTENRTKPVTVSGLTNATAIAAGLTHSCALTSSGGVMCWGENSFGQLGDGTGTSRLTPVAVSDISTATALASGTTHTCVLLRSQSVQCWGANNAGQLGDGTTTNRRSPFAVAASGANFIALAAGDTHTCAVASDGRVLCWGDNSRGQLGDGTTTSRGAARPVTGLSGAKAIAAGAEHTCAITTADAVQCWGANDFGQIGDGSTSSRTTPAAVRNLIPASSLSTGSFHSCAVVTGGRVQCWGANFEGQLGNGGTTDSSSPVFASLTGLSLTAKAVSTGDSHTCALLTTGGAACWGLNRSGQLGDGSATSRTSPVVVRDLSVIRSVSTRGTFTCALLSGGGVLCWGRNAVSNLGDGTTDDRPTPVAVSGLTDAIAISTGITHACAARAGGGVQCWGGNADGQLGDGSRTQRATPVNVTGVRGATAVTAGGNHSCALVTGGSIQCWGSNNNGQLGNGASGAGANSLTAVTVGSIRLAGAVSAGDAHTCAIVERSVQCWGANDQGQLGDGSTTPRPAPATVIGLADPLSVSAGARHSCAVQARGGVFCWGANDTGQLGDGTTIRKSRPNFVPSLSLEARAVSAGAANSCALGSNTAPLCWGFNNNGQLGDGAASNNLGSLTVGRVGTSRPAVSSAAIGLFHGCAVQGPTTIRCWGMNGFGQLGDGGGRDRFDGVNVLLPGQSQVGVPAVPENTARASAGGSIEYVAGWEVTEPLVWRDIDEALIVFTDEADETSFFVVTLQEREGDGSTLSAGDSPLISLDAGASRIQGSGPDGRTVTLTLNLTFGPEAAGRTFIVSMLVRTDSGDTQVIDGLGAITVE